MHKITLNEIKNSRQDTQYVARVDEPLQAHRCGRGAPHGFWLTLAEGAPHSPHVIVVVVGSAWDSCLVLVERSQLQPPSSPALLWSRLSPCSRGHIVVVIAVPSSSSFSISPNSCHHDCRCVVVVAVAAAIVIMVLRWRWLGTTGLVGRYVGDGVDAVACHKCCGSWPHDRG